MRDKGEAKTEAVMVREVVDVSAIADWLAGHLDGSEVTELIQRLQQIEASAG